MKCFEIKNGTVVPGLEIRKAAVNGSQNNPYFVLVGDSFRAERLFGSDDWDEGLQVPLSEALIKSFSFGTERLMEAEFVELPDGRKMMDVATNNDGVIIMYSAGWCQETNANFEFVAQADRPRIIHMYVTRCVYARAIYPYAMTSLYAGESVRSTFTQRKLRAGTGGTLLHPFRAAVYDNVVHQIGKVQYDGTTLIVKESDSK